MKSSVVTVPLPQPELVVSGTEQWGGQLEKEPGLLPPTSPADGSPLTDGDTKQHKLSELKKSVKSHQYVYPVLESSFWNTCANYLVANCTNYQKAGETRLETRLHPKWITHYIFIYNYQNSSDKCTHYKCRQLLLINIDDLRHMGALDLILQLQTTHTQK